MKRVSGKGPVERWGVYEIVLQGPSEKTSGRGARALNPFTDVAVGARFRRGNRTQDVKGFYDGEGVYRVRFMPDETGSWSWETRSNRTELRGATGSFTCVKPGPGNHGPVRVAKKHHFSYEDGTPFFPMGTTAYAWTYRPEAIRRQTLESFSKYGFNKIRMLFLPKHYGDGKNVDVSYDPPFFPFEGKPGAWDRRRFVPAYFRNFEDRVGDLCDRGIEADVILYHFYDFGKWGIDEGWSREDDRRYLDYLVARLAPHRNVWWSLANEYDLLFKKKQQGIVLDTVLDQKDWDGIGAHLAKIDPWAHLRSVHQWPAGVLFPNRTWLTHVSYQHPNTYSLLMDIRRRYGKPVIDDEYQYEGNIPMDWGSCSAEEETVRHWAAVMAGGYATHGEAFNTRTNKRDIFWSYGGTLRGGSPPRLRFMKDLLVTLPFQDMEPDTYKGDGRNLFCLAKGPEVYLYFMTPAWKDHRMLFVGPPGGRHRYEATVYDAWACRKVAEATWECGAAKGLELPRYAAIVLRRKRGV
ncbi:MAG: hypothetical protein A2177_05545 [Spirochaetes bacterium RBG_13_68_11]|nr:MAG: hypothetical protein A2177_05545 [Spirochaetes bacterium RBG_13_68_11]